VGVAVPTVWIVLFFLLRFEFSGGEMDTVAARLAGRIEYEIKSCDGLSIASAIVGGISVTSLDCFKVGPPFIITWIQINEFLHFTQT